MSTAKKWTVIATDGLDKDAEKEFSSDSNFVIKVIKETPASELATLAAEADFLIIRSATKLAAKDFAALPKLKGVVRAGVGIDNVNLEDAKAAGVYVWNAPTGNFISTAEHTMALIFSLFRSIPQADAFAKAGKWAKKEISSAGRQVSEKTLGLFGAGNIGSRVAKMAVGVGMKVVIADPYLKSPPFEGVRLVSFDELLNESDVISIHTPFTPETKGKFNLDIFKKMKKGAFIVNAARGGIINEADLLVALKEGLLSGAGLDVFEKEPFDTSDTIKALLADPRVIATPHIAASTQEAQKAVGIESAHKIKQVVKAAQANDQAQLPKYFAEGDFKKFL